MTARTFNDPTKLAIDRGLKERLRQRFVDERASQLAREEVLFGRLAHVTNFERLASWDQKIEKALAFYKKQKKEKEKKKEGLEADIPPAIRVLLGVEQYFEGTIKRVPETFHQRHRNPAWPYRSLASEYLLDTRRVDYYIDKALSLTDVMPDEIDEDVREILRSYIVSGIEKYHSRLLSNHHVATYAMETDFYKEMAHKIANKEIPLGAFPDAVRAYVREHYRFDSDRKVFATNLLHTVAFMLLQSLYKDQVQELEDSLGDRRGDGSRSSKRPTPNPDDVTEYHLANPQPSYVDSYETFPEQGDGEQEEESEQLEPIEASFDVDTSPYLAIDHESLS